MGVVSGLHPVFEWRAVLSAARPSIAAPMSVLVALVACVFLVALLYSSVGHAGASGYIAVMSLFALAPEEIKPIALALNILVASIGTWQFTRAGHFDWSTFWPFAALSVPMAFVGGYVDVPVGVFEWVVGLVLLWSAGQFFFRPKSDDSASRPALAVALASGAGLGFLSGLVGVGGGIFLTPLLLLAGWARTKTASAVSAAFILANSVAGLAGNLTATRDFPPIAIALMVAAVAGGSIGSYLGSSRLAPALIKRLLAVVLVIAGVKLLLT